MAEMRASQPPATKALTRGVVKCPPALPHWSGRFRSYIRMAAAIAAVAHTPAVTAVAVRFFIVVIDAEPLSLRRRKRRRDSSQAHGGRRAPRPGHPSLRST